MQETPYEMYCRRNDLPRTKETLEEYKIKYGKVGRSPFGMHRPAEVTPQTMRREPTAVAKGDVKKPTPQFARITFKALDDPEWLKANRNKTTIYLLLQRYVCRGQMANDKDDLYNRYFKQGKLVTSVSEQKLADLLGYKNGSRGSVQRWLDELEKEGAFSVVRVKRPTPMKPKKIFVLGRIIEGQQVYDYL